MKDIAVNNLKKEYEEWKRLEAPKKNGFSTSDFNRSKSYFNEKVEKAIKLGMSRWDAEHSSLIDLMRYIEYYDTKNTKDDSYINGNEVDDA